MCSIWMLQYVRNDRQSSRLTRAVLQNDRALPTTSTIDAITHVHNPIRKVRVAGEFCFYLFSVNAGDDDGDGRREGARSTRGALR